MTKQQTTELSPPVPVDLVDLDDLDDNSPRDDRSSESPALGRQSVSRRIFRLALVALAVALVLAVLGGVVAPYVYIHFIEGDPPKPLTFATTDSNASAPPSAPAGVAGAWKLTGGSTVGYRVRETLAGQKNTAVGRTTAVTGDLSMTNTSVRTGAFTVDVAQITSDAPGRDGSYGRIMETATFPTATFTLTKPIALATMPADLQQITVPATGNLTLHGVTKPVTFQLKARRNGSKIEANGSIPIAFSNYQIANPSLPMISVGNNGELEFLLVFTRR